MSGQRSLRVNNLRSRIDTERVLWGRTLLFYVVVLEALINELSLLCVFYFLTGKLDKLYFVREGYTTYSCG